MDGGTKKSGKAFSPFFSTELKKLKKIKKYYVHTHEIIVVCIHDL